MTSAWGNRFTIKHRRAERRQRRRKHAVNMARNSETEAFAVKRIEQGYDVCEARPSSTKAFM